jgi:hypothetical protein
MGTMSNRSPRTSLLPTFIYFGYPFNMENVDTIFPSSNETPYVADLNNDGYFGEITIFLTFWPALGYIGDPVRVGAIQTGFACPGRVRIPFFRRTLIGTDFWMFSSAIYTTYIRFNVF